MAEQPDEGLSPVKPETRVLLEAYREMLAFLFLSTIILVLTITSLLLWLDSRHKDLPILAFVAMSGALGAFFSALMRLYSLENLPAALLHVELKALRNRYLLMYSLIPPLTGIIGAVVLYVMVAGKLIGGDLFQKFDCSRGMDQCRGFAGLLDYSPIQPVDYAKSLVWGFIAGFSERLIPDAIGRLGKRLET